MLCYFLVNNWWVRPGLCCQVLRRLSWHINNPQQPHTTATHHSHTPQPHTRSKTERFFSATGSPCWVWQRTKWWRCEKSKDTNKILILCSVDSLLPDTLYTVTVCDCILLILASPVWQRWAQPVLCPAHSSALSHCTLSAQQQGQRRGLRLRGQMSILRWWKMMFFCNMDEFLWTISMSNLLLFSRSVSPQWLRSPITHNTGAAQVLRQEHRSGEPDSGLTTPPRVPSPGHLVMSGSQRAYLLGSGIENAFCNFKCLI